MDILDAYDMIDAAIGAGRVAGGYLVCGDVNGNCRDLVYMVLKRIFPKEQDQIEMNVHPDVAILEPEGKSRTIKIDDVREKIIDPMATTAYSGGWKAAVIVSADRMQLPAANAFLKNLEEPTPKTIYFLTTDRPEAILPTILSRCQSIALERGTNCLEGKDAADIEKLLSAQNAGISEKAAIARSLCAILAKLKDEAQNADVPLVRKAFYSTIMREARKWMLSGTIPNYAAFNNIEAVEEAFRRSERFIPDDAVLSYMLDRFILPQGK